MIQIPNRLINSLLSIFFLSLSIFFRKKALLIILNRFNLILCFVIIINLTLSLNVILFQKEWFKKINRISFPELGLIFCSGSFLLLFYVLATFGLDFTTSINYSFISRSTLIFTIVLAYFFLDEKIYCEKIFLIFFFFVGIYIISTEGKRIVLQMGDLLILIGTFFFSSFAIIQKKLSKNLPPNILAWAVISSSTIMAILVSFLLKVNLFPQHHHGFVYIFLAGITEALAILFMNKTIYITNVTYYSMMSMLTPIMNGFLGIIFLNESLNPIQFLGGFILIISGILVQRLRA
jgi:drug/metabolite transporter (DMT)-like permease